MTKYLIFCLFSLQGLAQTTDFKKGKQLFEDNNFVEAEKTFKSVPKQDALFHQGRYYLGRIAFAQKKYEDALTYFEEAIQANPTNADYHYWLGSTYGSIAQNANMFRQGTLAPKIKSSFEMAVKLDANHLNAHWGILEYYAQAPGFMGGSWEKAEQTAKAMIKIKPAEGYRALGSVYTRQEKWDDAEKAYLAMYKSDPLYIQVLGGYYLNRKMFDKALNIFDEVLSKDPENMLLNYQLGRACAISGKQLDRGEECLKKYLQHSPKQGEPSHAGANMRLAMIYEKRGNKAEAKKLYEKALQLDGEMKEAKEGLARVK